MTGNMSVIGNMRKQNKGEVGISPDLGQIAAPAGTGGDLSPTAPHQTAALNSVKSDALNTTNSAPMA